MAHALKRSDRPEIVLEGDADPIRIAVRENPRARRLTLRIDPISGDLFLTVPRGVSEREARRFAERQRGWIGAQLERLPSGIAFAPGAEIPFRGEPHLITLADGKNRGAGVVDRVATGAETPQLVVRGEAEFLSRRLTDWLKAEARRDLGAATEHYCGKVGTPATRIVVRDARTRWGSCSANRTLSYSWRLILSPPDVLAYVAAHEVAHLRHMDHGPAFWALVSEIMPEYRKPQAWLKRHGATLHRYGAQGA